jgi:tetratricopeptide (TPR) repeat protein
MLNELYLTALGKEGEDAIAAEQLYVQASAVDPTFALAHARASLLNSQISEGMTGDHMARKAKARAQAEEALRLSPTLGEAHMALGLCLYWGEKKYDSALKEFEVAAATSPNNAEIYNYVGGIYRRQGRWRDSVASFARALSLDPRNCNLAFFAGNNHLFMRDWSAATACYNRALKIWPDYASPKIGLAYLEVFRNGNPSAGRKILQNIPAGIDPDGLVTLARWDLAMLAGLYDCGKGSGGFSVGSFSLGISRPEDILPGPHRPCSRRHRIGPALFYRGEASYRKAGARRSRRGMASCPTRFTLRLHAEQGGCYSRKSSSRRTRARKPGRISWHPLGDQSGAGLCTCW